MKTPAKVAVAVVWLALSFGIAPAGAVDPDPKSLEDAKRFYPDCFTKGTRGAAAFTTKYEQFRLRNPSFFDSPNWPMILAAKAAFSLGMEAATHPGVAARPITSKEMAAFMLKNEGVIVNDLDAEVLASEANYRELMARGRWDASKLEWERFTRLKSAQRERQRKERAEKEALAQKEAERIRLDRMAVMAEVMRERREQATQDNIQRQLDAQRQQLDHIQQQHQQLLMENLFRR